MTLNQAYQIPAAEVEYHEEIKKSQFITYLYHAANVEEAKQKIQKVRLAHPQARHHCWAYVAGAPSDSRILGFSDDGEPAGTAGKPILAQLMGSGMGEVVAIVVRYYGGILLGTGGLVKAYGRGVQQALLKLETKEKRPSQLFILRCDYTLHQSIEKLIQANYGKIEKVDYADYITLHVAIPKMSIQDVQKQLTEISKGQIELSPEE